MNVLIVVAGDWPDDIPILARLKKGADTEHKTWRRKGDNRMKGLADQAGIELEEWVSEYDYLASGEGYANAILNAMDFVIVYATDKSSVTKFFVDKATKQPYNLIFGHKVEVNLVKVKAKPRKSTRRAE